MDRTGHTSWDIKTALTVVERAPDSKAGCPDSTERKPSFSAPDLGIAILYSPMVTTNSAFDDGRPRFWMALGSRCIGHREGLSGCPTSDRYAT